MYEGKPPRSGESRPLDEGELEGHSLRPLSWSDLVARLSAARDGRVSLEAPPDGGEGSFDAGSARLIAAHHNGKHPVNLDNSANGKGHGATAHGAVQGGGAGFAPEAPGK